MGNKIVSIVTVAAILIIFYVTVTFLTYDMKVQRCQTYAKEITSKLQYNGAITENDYYNMVRELPMEGAHLQITVYGKNKEGLWYITFLSDILGQEAESSGGFSGVTGDDLIGNGEYYFSRGDIVKVSIYDTNRNMLDSAGNMLFGKGGYNVKLIASDAGAVVNIR